MRGFIELTPPAVADRQLIPVDCILHVAEAGMSTHLTLMGQQIGPLKVIVRLPYDEFVQLMLKTDIVTLARK